MDEDERIDGSVREDQGAAQDRPSRDGNRRLPPRHSRRADSRYVFLLMPVTLEH